mmetsp:Transcript_19936/g.46560  ORF Transcript_19936/g.46560 Transcript_19936/m.46560 type:complete len:249 (-) Transcript_19936:179-925(-)
MSSDDFLDAIEGYFASFVVSSDAASFSICSAPLCWSSFRVVFFLFRNPKNPNLRGVVWFSTIVVGIDSSFGCGSDAESSVLSFSSVSVSDGACSSSWWFALLELSPSSSLVIIVEFVPSIGCSFVPSASSVYASIVASLDDIATPSVSSPTFFRSSPSCSSCSFPWLEEIEESCCSVSSTSNAETSSPEFGDVSSGGSTISSPFFLRRKPHLFDLPLPFFFFFVLLFSSSLLEFFFCPDKQHRTPTPP